MTPIGSKKDLNILKYLKWPDSIIITKLNSKAKNRHQTTKSVYFGLKNSADASRVGSRPSLKICSKNMLVFYLETRKYRENFGLSQWNWNLKFPDLSEFQGFTPNMCDIWIWTFPSILRPLELVFLIENQYLINHVLKIFRYIQIITDYYAKSKINRSLAE